MVLCGALDISPTFGIGFVFLPLPLLLPLLSQLQGLRLRLHSRLQSRLRLPSLFFIAIAIDGFCAGLAFLHFALSGPARVVFLSYTCPCVVLPCLVVKGRVWDCLDLVSFLVFVLAQSLPLFFSFLPCLILNCRFSSCCCLVLFSSCCLVLLLSRLVSFLVFSGLSWFVCACLGMPCFTVSCYCRLSMSFFVGIPFPFLPLSLPLPYILLCLLFCPCVVMVVIVKKSAFLPRIPSPPRLCVFLPACVQIKIFFLPCECFAISAYFFAHILRCTVQFSVFFFPFPVFLVFACSR